MSDKSSTTDRTFGIGAVAKLTGLSDHTIRVWERRYGAVVARRAANGRRRYTEADVQKLSLLKLLTDNGVAISRVANDATDELRQRARSMQDLSASPVPARIEIAVLGELLPDAMRKSARLGSLQLTVAETSRERFRADIVQHPVDVLVLELPAVGDETLAEVRELMALAGTSRAVLVYRFARSTDIAALRDHKVCVLRSPVTAEEIEAAAMRTCVKQPRAGTRRPASDMASSREIEDTGNAIEPRQFSQAQLAALSSATTGVDCECPRHLAHLVGDLSAFEVYSERCANRSDEDAALHRHLHRQTARARALLEAALERLARAEGLVY